jgi:hypothetical protein
MQENIGSQRAKISPQFAARLKRLKPEEKIRAVVMLRPNGSESPFMRGKGRNRQTLIDTVRQATNTILPDLDEILAPFGGKRLAMSVNALGTIPVETTAAGINALAGSEHVKAILEDQPIALPKLKRA